MRFERSFAVPPVFGIDSLWPDDRGREAAGKKLSTALKPGDYGKAERTTVEKFRLSDPIETSEMQTDAVTTIAQRQSVEVCILLEKEPVESP